MISVQSVRDSWGFVRVNVGNNPSERLYAVPEVMTVVRQHKPD